MLDEMEAFEPRPVVQVIMPKSRLPEMVAMLQKQLKELGITIPPPRDDSQNDSADESEAQSG